jgi:NAD(P)-dependent dehydrogenase (short-subunit alcohol dehydrogenase family)
LVGTEFGSAYSASKFGIEGWMRSLAPEIEPFGIATTIVNPGFFRTELLRPESTSWSELSMEDYAERDAAQRKGRESQDGKQTGDPAKLAEALVAIAGEDPPPTRFMAGADAVETAEQAVAELREQFEGHRELSSSLALNEDSQ